MRLISLDEMCDITTRLFNKYVEPLAETFMTGEVPAVTFVVKRNGTRESNWLAYTKFKNTVSISSYRCEVYLRDIMELCRRCKIYLITKRIFVVVALYSMLHPLFQTQYTERTHSDDDYDSMMSAAGKQAYRFMSKYFNFKTDEDHLTLNILKYYMMLYTNKFYDLERNENPKKTFDNYIKMYETRMRSQYSAAYYGARKYKANTLLVTPEGFIKMERKKDDNHG